MDYYGSLNAATLDPDIPTVFEILSARQLHDLINPSVRHIIAHYAQRNPQYLLRIANRFDELYLVVMGLVEHYHLKHWNSSFTERFYGLKRTNKLAYSALGSRKATPRFIESERRLTSRQRWLSLGFLILAPYLREKIEARYDVLKGKYAFRSIEEDRPSKDDLLALSQFYADKMILVWFPRYSMAESVTTVCFLMGYLFQTTTATSLVDFIVSFRYSRLTQFDYQLNSPESKVKRWQDHLLPNEMVKRGLGMLSYTLPTALFLLKFFEWWNSSDFASKLTKIGPELPPPSTGIENLKLEGCPICGKTQLDNPTVLETGVVFCYKCIYNHLASGDKSKTPICPATNKRLLLTVWKDDVDEWQPGGLRRLMI